MAKTEVEKPKQELMANTYKALSVPAQQLTSFLIENLGNQGLKPTDLDKIKVPAGGGLSWEVPTLKGPEPMKVVEGIILHFKDVRAYWKSKDTTNSPPDCSSSDGITGVGDPGGTGRECARCPLAQFNSATDAKGQPSKGQACKQMRLMLLIRQENMLPMLVSLPPTSIQNAKKYFLRLVANGYPYYSVTTQLRLVQAKNAGGTAYSQAQLDMGRELDKDELEKVQMIGQAMRQLFTSATVVDADVTAHE